LKICATAHWARKSFEYLELLLGSMPMDEGISRKVTSGMDSGALTR
jgi:hypothetical protein